MTERTEYAVLRFVDKNGYCHMINDYVKGAVLTQYLKAHPQTEKTIFWGWLEKMSALAVQYYKWKEGECYGYFNPYAMILTEEEGLVFLDTKDEENEELIGFMQKKSVRALFMRPERVLSLKMTFDDDMYGLGKTIQFLAAKCTTVPGFTRKEEKCLRRVVGKCLDKRVKGLKDLKEVHRELKALRDGSENTLVLRRMRKRLFAAAAAVSIIAVTVSAVLKGETKGQTARANVRLPVKVGSESAGGETGIEEGGESEPRIAAGGRKEAQVRTQLEMGLLYLTELEDEEQSRVCLEEIAEESGLADTYLKLLSFLNREKSDTYAGRELEHTLQAGEEELDGIKEEAWWEQKQDLYLMPFLRGYGLLNTKSAAEHSIQICGELLENNVWKTREKGKQRELEVRTYLAGAFETADEEERAIEEYEAVKELEQEISALEQIYMKLENLYEKTGAREKVWQLLKEGTEKVPQSQQIWIRYLRQCCADSSIERAVCAEYIKNAFAAVPGIADNEEFEKLKNEYEITVEGENICVGR